MEERPVLQRIIIRAISTNGSMTSGDLLRFCDDAVAVFDQQAYLVAHL